MQEANHEKVFPLWVPYVFSGMPSFASLMVAGERTYDITNTIWDGINNFFSALMVNTDVAWAVLYYFFFGIGIFLLLRRLDIGKFASFFAATATIFSTGIIIWIMFGHGTKIITISFLPYIFLFTLELFKKIRLLYVIGLTLAIHLMLEGSHVQMIFYTAFALAIYFVYVFFMTLFKKKNLLPVMQTAFFLGVAGLLAFAMSSDKYMSILEYNKYSIRGTPPIVQEPGSNSQARSGLDYDYATGWSFSPEELTTFFVPSFYGFGDYEYNGPLSNNQPVRVNTYFGQMTFTDFPEYMGVITIILAVIGFFRNRKNRFVQFSLLIIIIALLISFGRNFSILFDPMFYYFPYFNSFRAPSMILVLVQIFLPILAAFGIDAIVKARESGDLALSKKVLWWGGAFVAFLLLALLMNSSLQDFYYGIIDSSRQRLSREVYPLLFDNMTSDLYICLLISIATCGIIYFYLKGKMRSTTTNAALIAILLVDLWRVDAKPMVYSNKAQLQDEFTKPDYVSYIQQDSSLYRVIQLQNLSPQYSNTLAYFLLQNAYGYAGAKLRNYQNMMDVAGITNPNVLRLLDVKYIISDKPDSLLGKVVFHGSQLVLRNSNILPRAFFVSNYKVASALNILESLRDGTFDPAKTVYFETDPQIQIEPPDSGASVRFTDYELQSMKMQVHATGNNFLVLSEVYYPKGWEAFVDGEKTHIYESDYFLRGIEIPQGSHTVEFKFHPATYYIGREVSVTTNIVLLLGIVGTTGYSLVTRKRKKIEGQAKQSGSDAPIRKT